jgi:hypothetical protein
MTLIERFWRVVTYFVSIVSLSPNSGWGDFQTPLQKQHSIKPSKGYPIFKPPGAPRDGRFNCEYPDMEGWEDCSHELDRKCWLRHTKTGKQFDINTDYETKWPKGIDRYYYLDLANSTYAADGLPFVDAKLFNEEYPGPWIEACWGDR